MRKTIAAASLVAVLALAGCAPQLASTDGGDDDGADAPVIEASWSPESDCASCHSSEAEVASGCLMELHGSVTCSTCHDDADGALAEAHEGYTDPKARLPKKLRATTVSTEACESCHDLAEITEKSEACTALTDANGTVVNPHEIMVRESHVANSGADLNCGSCHKMHEADSGDASAAAAETASEKCLGCHHQNVYECGTCHE